MTTLGARSRVVIVHRTGTSFAERDERLLSAVACVQRVQVKGPSDVLRSFAAALRSDAVLIWFASVHAVAPLIAARLRNHPVIIVPGGYEVALVAERGYGWQGSWARRRFVQSLLRWATSVAAVSPSIADLIRVASPGVIPVLIPNTVEDPGTVPDLAERPYDVATALVPEQEAIKGIDLLLQAAHHLPHLRFLIVGAVRAQNLPGNVTVTGLLSPLDAEERLGDARVYVQATRGFEAFGSALLEAMVRGATPVVTEVGGMPWVVADAGIVVRECDVTSLIDGIREALEHPRSQLARQRVLNRFATVQRVALLSQALHLSTMEGT